MIEAKKSVNLAPNKHAKCEGFTLIELLVVIAIIAILASILMPVLSKAQARAKQTESLNNTKQWAVAQNMYVDDNNQYLPLTKIPQTLPGVPGGYNEDRPQWADLGTIFATAVHGGNAQLGQAVNGVWFDALPNYVGGSPLYAYFLTISGGTVIYNQGHNIFHCPSAMLPSDHNILDPNKQVVFEYGMNSKGLYGNYGTTEIGNNTNAPLRATVIKHPSAFVMFSDGRVNPTDDPAWDTFSPAKAVYASPQCYTTRFSMRHNNGANIGFSDGHAARFKYDYVVVNINGKPSDPGQPDINWSYDGTSIDGVGAP